jgi:hypothetical protein
MTNVDLKYVTTKFYILDKMNNAPMPKVPAVIIAITTTPGLRVSEAGPSQFEGRVRARSSFGRVTFREVWHAAP